MKKSGNFLAMLIPSSTVFVSSACIMTIELIAGRLVARDLGSSLYTWTSIIGIVLLGISIGNYGGGIIADRFPTKKTLSLLFAISSAACILTVAANNIVGSVDWLGDLSWPMRVATHIALVFLLPSIILGAISPVVAKRALQQGLAVGRTIGDLYAWATIGSIAGTFVTGFYLIANVGTTQTVWGVAAVLILMSILYSPKSWIVYLWLVIFLALLLIARSKDDASQSIGYKLKLRQQTDPRIIYETESQYSYMAVRQLIDVPNVRAITFNNGIATNRVNLDDITDLRDTYMKIYAAATTRFIQNDKPAILVLGGGAYVFPRYVDHVWPGSQIDVVEIDPAVTSIAQDVLGLEKDSAINIITMDSRNYLDDLLEKETEGEGFQRYDFVYGDCFNDFAVPYQLVTKEFNDKIAQVLTDDGIYMLNIIDLYESGQFLGAVINTMQKTFPAFYVVSQSQTQSQCSGFVIIAGKKQFTLDDFADNKWFKRLPVAVLTPNQITALQKKTDTVLTDNYTPVENLLSPAVVRASRNRSPSGYPWQ